MTRLSVAFNNEWLCGICQFLQPVRRRCVRGRVLALPDRIGFHTDDGVLPRTSPQVIDFRKRANFDALVNFRIKETGVSSDC